MNESTSKKLHLFTLAVLALTALQAILRTVCLFTIYEADLGYFARSVLSIFVNILYAAGLILCALPLFVLPKKGLTTRENSWFRTRLVSSLVCAIAFLFCGVAFLASGAINSHKLDFFSGILSVVGALFFLFTALSAIPSKKGRFDAVQPWLCGVIIVSLLLMLSSAYFDMTVAINGPFAIVYLFSVLACVLFLLCEMRLSIDRPCPRAHFVTGLIALFLSASSAVGNLSFCFFGDTGVGKTVAEPTRPILLLALALYILARLLTFGAQTESEES